MRWSSFVLAGLFGVWLSSVALAEGEAPARWPQFRGLNALGVSPDEKQLPAQLEPGKNLLWKTPVPTGHSSPCIWGDRIFLTGFDRASKKLDTFCLDRRTGEVLWSRTAPAERIEKVHAISSPATPTPVTDGERVYVYFGSYGLLCYDTAGNEVWKKPLPIPKIPFGTGTSPALAEDLLLLSCQGQDFCLLALDCRTGKEAWKKERAYAGGGYSVPLVRRHAQGTEVIVQTTDRVMAYDLKDGAERWWVFSPRCQAIPSPILGDGLVFAVAQVPGGDPTDRFKLPPFDELLKQYDTDKDGMLSRQEVGQVVLYSRGSPDGVGDITMNNIFEHIDFNKDGKISRLEWFGVSTLSTLLQDSLLAIRPGEQGDLTKTNIVWKETRSLPEIPSPLYYQGRLYVVKKGGLVSCFEAKTGKLLYRERLGPGGDYYSSPVAGDGKIYAASQSGVVTVWKAGDTFEVLARNKFPDSILATPALVDGKVYVRTEKHCYAFGE